MKTHQRIIGGSMAMAILVSASSALLAGPVKIVRTNYHGWADSLWMSNGQVEVIVVPAIGRIMRLCFAGGENFLRANRSLDGKTSDGKQKGVSRLTEG